MYEQLRNAFAKKNLVLYLGAGVSIDSNLPSWDTLVLSMYFKRISEQDLNGWRPFSNYLYAISEWMLESSEEPLEIVARKLKSLYSKQQSFLDDLYQTLYGSYLLKVLIRLVGKELASYHVQPGYVSGNVRSDDSHRHGGWCRE